MEHHSSATRGKRMQDALRLAAGIVGRFECLARGQFPQFSGGPIMAGRATRRRFLGTTVAGGMLAGLNDWRRKGVRNRF
jgi:hypothetical protein